MTLVMLQQIRNIYCAIWTECVWQIADASDSRTKFIVSDHPVTVYNRGCPPLSQWCLGHNDPDIRMAATHTIFPLSLNKVLIFTNLNWVRDPYQKETTIRPNPQMFRNAIFKFTSIQTQRILSEDEVLMMNSIIKRRAYRYIAAADKEWLYPENYVSTDHWKKLGDGYLLMPEPRLIHMGGEILIGYKNGKSDAFSEYGHKPWQKGYKDTQREKRKASRCIGSKLNGRSSAARAIRLRTSSSCASDAVKMTQKTWTVTADYSSNTRIGDSEKARHVPGVSKATAPHAHGLFLFPGVTPPMSGNVLPPALPGAPRSP